MNETAKQTPARRVDVIVVGAGFGGMYAVHRFREMGKSVLGIETGGDVGGVWYWNRYPGARCDLMSVDYSYGFSDEIQQDWSWSEQFAAQPEILAYANFVADRLKLRDNYLFDTRVEAAKWDEASQIWRARLSDGQVIEAAYCIMATGPLSVAKDPEIDGIDKFAGTILRAQKWPHHPVDFKGQRVGVIGTGSSGIQVIQEVGRAECELFVYQRTPSWTLPMRNHVLDDAYQVEMKANYPAMRAAMRLNPTGGTRPVTSRPYFSLPPEQRIKTMEQAWDNGGHTFLGSFSDLLVNQNANDQVADFVRDKIAQTVNDPATAQALMPRGYPIFARRPCLDTGYYETFNQPNVYLKDCLSDPIVEITEKGIRTEAGEVELDIIIFATGYDALTGALMAFDVQGRNGRTMTDKWRGGAESYLGLMVEGFPNMFLTCGPNGPAALANIITISEHDVDWIAALISHMEANSQATVEATPAGEGGWMEVVTGLAAHSPMCQYSAVNGAVQPWHMVHLGGLMLSGAGLVIAEATAVEAAGRITHGCMGLYNDTQEARLTQLVRELKQISPAALGLQLSHAGRRGSARSIADRSKGESLPNEEGAWQTFGPCAFGYDNTWQKPKAMDEADIERVVTAFAKSASRAVRAGIDLIEIHAAHGYLLHQFLSPVTNLRTDTYGGSLENRMRFPVQVLQAVRDVLPVGCALGVRVNATDWDPQGLTLEDAVVFANALKSIGVDYVVMSAGNLAPGSKIPPATPGHQVSFAQYVKQETGLLTMAVGLIATPDLAEDITGEGRADMVAIGRGMLDDPRWGWHAAAQLGVDAPYLPQYIRARPNNWIGYPLSHDGIKPAAVSHQLDRPASGKGYDRPAD